METYEEDDDTHFCIKCHSTINGLESYVRHRQSGCRPPETKPLEVVHEPPSTPTTVTYPEILNADAFFSSLELQSSAKINRAPRARILADREKKAGRSDDKNKKKGRRGQEADEGGSKEKLLNMPPVVNDLDDFMDHLAIPSLVGFPDIVTTPGGKSSAVISGKLICTPSSARLNNGENLSESPVETIMTSSKGSSERKRIEDPLRIDKDSGPWLDDPILIDSDVNSDSKEAENVDTTSYTDSDYQRDDDFGEDSMGDDAEDDETSSNEGDVDENEYSSHGHTGGKWKPCELLQDINRINEDEFVDDEDNHERPPSSHTGGKWKPADNSQIQRIEENEVAGKDPGASSLGPLATTGREPPPGHTRGKWIPGAPGDFGSGYWCDPCGRKLASRLVYNRHLLSDLHARRSIQEIDGDLQLPLGVGLLLQRKPTSKRQRALAEIKSDDDRGTGKKPRKRQKEVITCEMCQARVQRTQMGKHLLSHYHCRVAGTKLHRNPRACRFILENMADVVRQCPFQCGICRFYCNTEETFMLHWRSTLHTDKINNIDGSYKCTPCDFYCDDNEEIEKHLSSSAHREVVLVLNGSVPIVIGRQRSLVCETCNTKFRYNMQLKLHVRMTGHRGSFTITDKYQSKMICTICCKVVRSLVALQRHQLARHGRGGDVKDDKIQVVQPGAPYFCSYCMLNFTSAHAAMLHRRTSTHKEIVEALKFRVAPKTRECPYCGAKHNNLMEHKSHLLQHPEMCHRCPRCGKLFPFPQDVTRHTRDVECTKPIEEKIEPLSNGEEWRCTNCVFTTESQAEYLFHEALHSDVIEDPADKAGSSKAPPRYKCPLCEKIFCKVTLRNHIRRHTGERPFRCIKCSESFVRRSSLNIHRRECESPYPSSEWPRDSEGNIQRQRKHLCAECNSGFYTNRMVQRYVTFVESYKKRSWGFWKKTATRVSRRFQPTIEWYTIEECCTGYVDQSRTPLRCIPTCSSGCQHGKCSRPNVCTCDSGFRVTTIHGSSHCLPDCGEGGDNGGGCGAHAQCIAPRECQCETGYTPTVKRAHPDDEPTYVLPCIPKCKPACSDNAYCHAPNKCQCNVGYRSDPSAVTVCVAICENECINGMCVSPNKCICLPGYKPRRGNDFMCEPICDNECTNANCTRPNHCECHQGYQKHPEEPPYLCSPICNPPCVNADCTRPNHCECHQGYQKKIKDSPQLCLPVCDPPCINGGCVEPNYCECYKGYGKSSKDPSHICAPMCSPPCIHANCSEPNHCECHNGYQKNSKVSSQICSPVCNPACTNADCTQPNHCECHKGYGNNPKNPQICSPICNPPCINADCTRPNHCECHEGYKTNDNGTPGLCSPICHPLCVNANCTEPDHCECHDGYKTKSNDQPHVCSPICDPPCVNATCDRPNHCECHNGYSNNSTAASQLCSPICNPGCGSNAYCRLPNKCECDFGYVVVSSIDSNFTGSEQSPNNSTNQTDGPRYAANTAVLESIACRPLCEPECPKNGICIAPNVCQCDVGYRYDSRPDRKTSEPECIPICTRDCINGYCGYPNKCSCFPGYKPSLFEDFVCEPFCQHDCINARCTQPDYCECIDGYEKAELELADSHENLTISDNLCIPTCTEECVNATCIAPDTCLCSPGYVLNNTSTDLSEQLCEPLCEPSCSSGLECVAPNRCQDKNNEGRTENFPDLANVTENCSYINENGTCVCTYGWTGLRCDEPLFCVVTFTANYLTQQLFSILNSNFSVVNNTIDYNESYYENVEELDWQGQPCREKCRITMLSEDSSVNISHDVLQCRRLELLNPNNDLITADNISISKERENTTTVCFVRVGSECNRLEMELCKFEGTMYVIAGVSLLAIVTVVGTAMYFACRKRRTILDKSISNSSMLEWPESTPTTRIIDNSSL